MASAVARPLTNMPGSKKKKSDSGGNGVAATEGGNTQPDDARKPAALEFHPAIDGDTKSLMLDQVGHWQTGEHLQELMDSQRPVS